MEDSEGVLSFDFEGGLDAGPTTNPAPASRPPHLVQSDSASGPIANANAAATAIADPAAGSNPAAGRWSICQTRHWLYSLCMKGDTCGFLYQRTNRGCPSAASSDSNVNTVTGIIKGDVAFDFEWVEENKTFSRYKLGFCPNGPDCRYRHAKLPGPPPPIEEVLQKIQHLSSYNYNSSNRFYQQRNGGFPQRADKSQFPQGPNTANQGVVGKPSTIESANVQQQQQSQQQVSQNQIQNVPSGLPNQSNRSAIELLYLCLKEYLVC
ncbi:Cleavage and polyadenylation specificity factor CPSF30 [Morella rubra]|uniref:Cleavage and polyadenylation specificity factor CPSF30 n=1 Tax=Morella rubra TaxID=262757 RepID=A0A6A1WFJ7_9ROSI|nr:Cleavage and polyadenylation specificity factor CPSF30 [Morella rubra]